VRGYGAADKSGIPESELIRANREIRDYLNGQNAPPLSIAVTTESGGSESLFNARETAHMADVRSLVQSLFTVQVLAVAAVLTLGVAIFALMPLRALAAALLYGALVTAGLLGVAGILAMSGFDGAWSRFHELSFANDLWQLNPRTDHLIQMYPEAFWQEVTTLIGVFTMLQSFAIAALAAVYLFLTRQRPAERRTRPELPGRAGHARLAPPNPRHYVR
jgi:integral membrane protein (TIGR01906 family)